MNLSNFFIAQFSYAYYCITTIPWEDERCLHMAFPAQHCFKCQLNLSLQRTTTATHTGCVQHGLGSETTGARRGSTPLLLLKMTHDPAYSSWTPKGSLQTRYRYWAASL